MCNFDAKLSLALILLLGFILAPAMYVSANSRTSYHVSYHYIEAKANYKYGEGYCFVNLKGSFDFNKTPALILKAVKAKCIENKTKEVILTNVSRMDI